MRIIVKLLGKRISNVTPEELAELYEQGFKLEELANALRVDKNTIAYHLGKTNVQMRPRGRVKGEW